MLINIIRTCFALFYILSLLYAPASSHAFSPKDLNTPQALEEWKSWVLYEKDEFLCPFNYNDGDIVRCTWPSRLKISVENKTGIFQQEWSIFAEGMVQLPGGGKNWPLDVKSDGKKIPVTNKNNRPFITLIKGSHTITGSFAWEEIPETLSIPSDTALTSLSVKGLPVGSPVIDRNDRLWIQKRTGTKNDEDRLEVHLFRLIDDSIPTLITTYLHLNISGKTREILLDDLLLEDSIPVNIQSPLPSRIRSQNSLMIQARPGNWNIFITSRFTGPINKIGPVKGKYGEEIWSFKAAHHLRMVKISGADQVEPARTNLPSQWKGFPAYLMKADTSLDLQEIKRGDSDPGPDKLNIHRTWWLDFNGKGFTIRDKITGIMSKNWSIALNPPGVLGKVSVNGTNRLITSHGKDKKPGVELRQGNLNLLADSRLAREGASFSTAGWDHDFQSFSGCLNLPPGWRLFSAKGVETVPATWFKKWTLLDIFILLIIAVAMYKIRGISWGIITLVTIIFLYHEPGAPRLIWLHLLATSALIKVLPKGWFRRLIFSWNIGAIIVLLVISIPFMIIQIQTGIYPQLEKPEFSFRQQSISPGISRLPDTIGEADEKVYIQKAPYVKSILKAKGRVNRSQLISKSEKSSLYPGKKQFFSHEPNALIQTGPGLPKWKWRTIKMNLNGPVDKTQQVRLCLVSPFLHLLISIVRVILLIFLIIGMINIKYWRTIIINGAALKNGAAIFVLISFLPFFSGGNKALAMENSFPPPSMLEELQDRLLQQPDCLPFCADCKKLHLMVTDDILRILLEIHALSKVAVPLPGTAKTWVPENIFIDNKPAKALLKDDNGVVWILLPKGIHMVLLQGKTGQNNTIQIPLPLKPHTATLSSAGWAVQGIHENSVLGKNIQITRIKKKGRTDFNDQQNNFTPFLHVERELDLGLTWGVTTRVKRLTPAGIPLVVSIGLLESESVITGGIHVKNDHAHINMEAGTKEIVWRSRLEPREKILLKAPESVPWTETWILNLSPVWHCELSGIPVIFHQDNQKNRQPRWMPWPGEEVVIDILRPEPIPGQTLTITEAELEITPGRRIGKGELRLNINTSQGVQHQVLLPVDAKLQSVKIDRKSQPIGQKENKVLIPLQPGNHILDIEWRFPSDSLFLIKGPIVKTGAPGVNAKVTFNIPRDRWILWATGLSLGPAVLFCGYLIVVMIIAVGMGRIPHSPLTTRSWLLLFLGLTQVSPLTTLIIAGCFIVFSLREKYMPEKGWFFYNLMQGGLILLAIAALSGLYHAIEKGLLGIPRMQISGNMSDNFHLHWFQDLTGSLMPRPLVVTLPAFVYHILMLAWALWIAFSLINWLKWGWLSFSKNGIWRKPLLRKKQKQKETASEIT